MDDGGAVQNEAFDAEAVLLALGASLEWVRYEHDDYAEEEARTPTGRYLIKKSMWYRFFRDEVQYFVYFSTDGNFQAVPDLPPFMSFGGAKVACERHHVTGKWQS